MALSANAQMDGFFNSNDNGNNGGREGGTLPMLPGGKVGEYGADQPATAPLGSGLIILTALGAGYAVSRRKK